MVWLIGNKGMLGTDIEAFLEEKKISSITSDKEVDITSIDALRTFIGDQSIDYIINCAAYTAVDKAEDEEELAYRINSEGPKNIAIIAKEKDAKLIHFSTDYVFSGNKKNAYHEEDETDPLCIYGKSKLSGENNISATMEKYFIIRISWLFGIHGPNFVYTMLRLLKERDEIRVVSDQWGSPTYTRDAAYLALDIIQNDRTEYGIYHFTNVGRTNWYEFVLEINRQGHYEGILDKEVKIIPITTAEYPTKAKRPMNSYLSKDKFSQVSGVKIRSWQDALTDFIYRVKNKVI